MTTGITILPSVAPAPRLSSHAVPILVLLGALAIYAGLRTALLAIATSSPENCLALDVVAIVGAWTLSDLRYSDIPSLLRPLMRGIAGVVLVQVAFDGSTLLYAPTPMVAGANGAFFCAGTVIAIAAGLVAMGRPSFTLPLLFHYVAFRHQLNRVSGVPISETDYLSMLDIGEFVAIGALFTVILTGRRARHLLPSWVDLEDLKKTTATLIWIWAVGAHFGNYFISGWTKIQAGGSEPLFWLLHNPTQTSILIGLERGNNPLAAWPSLVQFSWDAITTAGIALNLFVLGVQICAPLALLHRRVLMVFTLIFDLFHVAVVGTLGAFFFFWIAVNVLIYISARAIDDKAMTPLVKATGLIALLGAHFLFYTSHLGWLDGAKLASPSFYAETGDGRIVPIPPVYFGIMSYSIGQTAMFIPDDHFPMRLGGNTYNRKDWQDAQSCGPDTLHKQETGVSLDTVESMVREGDAAMRRTPLVKDANLFYFYPHHMVANPLMFGAFNRLSMNDIVGYRYSVESVCLSLRAGRLVRDVRKRTDYEIDVSH
ncbi:MAG: hypothetical protein JWM91_3972 [Rhodospirillales bacterium]|nr:hypothetical protein [Rhodospirillales bacterium]